MALENRYVFHSGDLLPDCPHYDAFRDSVSESAVLASLDSPRTSAGEFTDAYGNTYLLLLNRDYDREADLRISFREPVRVYEVSRETGRQTVLFDTAAGMSMKFAPGDGRLFRIQPASEEPYTLEYRLEK